MGVHCEYKALKERNPAPQPNLGPDLHEHIMRAGKERITTRNLLDMAEEAGYAQSTIDQARKRHTEALSELKSLTEILGGYQINLMLLKHKSKEHLLKAREEQDAVIIKTVTGLSSHLPVFPRKRNKQVTTASYINNTEGQPLPTPPPHLRHQL
ncbi:hypothetical protein PMIN03_003076 [Paraphaeosphaeria minitans]